MTYKEAQEYIDDNEVRILDRIRETQPPSELWGTYIAPEIAMGDREMQQMFFNEVVLEKKDNESIVLNLSSQYLQTDKLRPFVVLRMAGNPITLSLQGYLESGFSGVETGGKAS